jgi:hypothetical protein
VQLAQKIDAHIEAEALGPDDLLFSIGRRHQKSGCFAPFPTPMALFASSSARCS